MNATNAFHLILLTKQIYFDGSSLCVQVAHAHALVLSFTSPLISRHLTVVSNGSLCHAPQFNEIETQHTIHSPSCSEMVHPSKRAPLHISKWEYFSLKSRIYERNERMKFENVISVVHVDDFRTRNERHSGEHLALFHIFPTDILGFSFSVHKIRF